MWSHTLVDFSGCTVATGRKPVVGGRAVHSSDSSLVGYRPSRCGERTNEGYRSFLYSSIHARTSARTSSRSSLGWPFSVLLRLAAGSLYHALRPSYRAIELGRYSRSPFFQSLDNFRIKRNIVLSNISFRLRSLGVTLKCLTKSVGYFSHEQISTR